MENLCGWTPNPEQVDIVLATMPRPWFGKEANITYEKKDVLLYDIVRKVTGGDLPPGPQGIGDCVSWGDSNGVNVLACKQIAKQLHSLGLFGSIDPEDNESIDLKNKIIETYEPMASEAIYALGRCEVGKQWNSYSDGSVGAWGAKAITTFGNISRPELKRQGMSENYDPKRAKEWGAKGLPDKLEPTAKLHIAKTASLVRNADEAATAIIEFYNPVIVCSNRGFSLKRDSQGFCSPEGTWNHCMLIVGIRFDRPGFCISQSWGAMTPSGPLGLNQPTNTFWADWKVVESMLAQGDSFTINDLEGYTREEVDLFSWKH